MKNECEALPGVAYPGVRDNRSGHSSWSVPATARRSALAGCSSAGAVQAGGDELRRTSPITACRSPRFLVASICDPPVAVNSLFLATVAALSALVLSPLRAQQFGILCLTVCVIQLLGLISFDVT